MLKTVVSIFNAGAAIYFLIAIGGAIYEKGREDGKKDLIDHSVVNHEEANNNERYVVINGVKYEAVER